MFLDIVTPKIVTAYISIATILASKLVLTGAETCGFMPGFVGEERKSLPTIVTLKMLPLEV